MGRLVSLFSKSNIKFALILGNHDQNDSKKYNSNITLVDQLTVGPFLFTHYPEKEIDNSTFVVMFTLLLN